MTETEFRREVRFEKGHTIRKSKGDGQDYGVASMSIRFLLHGDLGSTQFLLYTGWTPEKVQPPADRWGLPRPEWSHMAPLAFDLGYHWDAPLYEDQASFECAERPSGRCFYDGSSLQADRVLETFFLEGEDAMWAVLRDQYVALAARTPATVDGIQRKGIGS